MNFGRHIVGVHTEEKGQGHSSNCLGGSVQESFLKEVALSLVAQQEEGSSALSTAEPNPEHHCTGGIRVTLLQAPRKENGRKPRVLHGLQWG